MNRARAGGSGPATFLLDEFLELRTFESFPGLRRVLHDVVDGLVASGNRFVLTSRYVARSLRLLRDHSARFEVIHMPGNQGGSNWGSGAVNAAKGLMYLNTQDWPTVYKLSLEDPLGKRTRDLEASPDIWSSRKREQLRR